MELRHLHYFVAIAEEGSFTRAAERLWVAQPGLSTQIRRLETELGVRLFDRHTRGVDLTVAGELFLERARVALAAAEVAAATGAHIRGGVSGTLRVGLASGPAWEYTPQLLNRFARERTGVELTVLEAPGGTLWRELRDRRLDAVIAPSMFRSVDLRSLGLGAEPWVVLVGAPHRLSDDGPLSWHELESQQLAVSGRGDDRSYDRAISELLEELGVTAALVPCGPGPALLASVACGDALALTTAPTSLAPGMIARALNPRRTLAFELLWRDETPAPALEEFISTAHSVIAPRGCTPRPVNGHLRRAAMAPEPRPRRSPDPPLAA
jgi:DNA-binding transcriptional LysR family regulator